MAYSPGSQTTTVAPPRPDHKTSLPCRVSADRCLAKCDEDKAVRTVYLLGLPRSGTTMLAHLFAGLPGSLSLSEPYLAHAIYAPWRMRRFMRRIAKNAQLRADPLPNMTTESEFHRYLVTLTSTNGLSYLFVKETYRAGQTWDNVTLLDRLACDAEPFITIIRHPYDLAVSSLRFARWWRGAVGRVLRIFAPGLPLFDSDRAVVGYCADNWVNFADWCMRQPNHRIRYEDLVCEPERCIRAACEYVGLPFDPRMVDHTHPRGPFGGIGDPGVMNRPAKPVGTGSVGRKHLLKPEFVDIISKRCRDHAARFDYEL